MAEIMEQRQWQKPDMIAVTKKDPRFGYRYFRKDRVDAAQDEGWEVVRKGTTDLKTSEATSSDGAIHYRGLILMRMPRQMVDQRNAYWQERHQKRLRAAGVASGMSQAAEKINDKTGEKITGTVGTVVIKSGVKMEDGSTRNTHTQAFQAEDVDKQDLKELADVKVAQEKENKRMSEEEDDEPTPRSKSKKRR